MLHKKFSMFITVLILSSAGLAATKTSPTTKNPMKYATQVSQNFAAGDSNDSSGWNICRFQDSDPEDGVTTILCDGTREILVHGGEMVTSQFQCEFQFEESLNPSKHFITIESCE